MKQYEKEKFIETKLFIFFHRNLQFQKIIKNFAICDTRMRDEDQTHMHPCQPVPPTTTQWLGEHHTVHTSQF